MRPLSERDHPYACGRSYTELFGRARERRIEGDCLLLVELENACRRFADGPFGSGVRRTVAELPADELRGCVVRAMDRCRGYELSGDDGQRLLDRLDAHFAPLQEVWLRERIAARELADARARELDELRAEIAERNAAGARVFAEALEHDAKTAREQAAQR